MPKRLLLRRWIRVAALPLVLTHCGDDGSSNDPTAGTDAGGDASSTAASSAGASGSGSGEASSAASADADSDTGNASPGDAQTQEFMTAIAGLWRGPVTSGTSAGNFPTMNMDARPADDSTMFARCDLDEGNSLRFAFSVETHDGEDILVYRNGGYFQGVLRDTRTALMDHDTDANSWRFCALSGGCAYIDATFAFPESDTLTLDVEVLGMFHIAWTGTRAESRALKGDFPYSAEPGAPDGPFPEMPSLTTTVTWAEPTTGTDTVWVMLMTEPCGITPVGCTPARFLRVTAPKGATSAMLTMEQIHADTYYALAVVDRNGNLPSTLIPDAGDSVSIPDTMVVVDDTGESTASIAVVVDL